MSAPSPSSRRRVVLFARDGAASPMPSASVPSLSSSPSPPPKGGYVPAEADLCSGSANRGTGNTMVRGEERRSLSPAEKAQRLRQSIADAAARGVSARGRWEGESDASTFSDNSQPSSQSSSSSTSLPRGSRHGRPAAAAAGRFNNNSSTNTSKKAVVNANNANIIKAVASASMKVSRSSSNTHPAAHNSTSRPLPLDTDITALLVARSRTTATADGTARLSSNRRRGDRRTEEVPSFRRASDCNSAVNIRRREEEGTRASSSQQRYRGAHQNVPDEPLRRPSAGTYNRRGRQGSRRGSSSSPSSPSSDSRVNASHREYASGDGGRRREHTNNAHSDEEAHSDDGGGELGMRRGHTYSEEARAMARCIGDVSAAVGAVERELRAARREGRAARRQSAAAAEAAAITSTRTHKQNAYAKRYRSDRRSASPPSTDVGRGYVLYPSHAYASSPPAARRGASPSLGLVHSDSEGADRKHAYLPHGENPTSQPRRRRRTSSAHRDRRHHRGASSHAARPSSVSSHSSSSSSSPSTGRHRRYNSHRRSGREEATTRRGDRYERSNERQHATHLGHHHHAHHLRQRDALFRDRHIRSDVQEVGRRSGRGREGDSKHRSDKRAKEASEEFRPCKEEDGDSSAAYAPQYSAETLRLVALEQRMTSLALRLSANAYLRGDRSRSVSQSRSRSRSRSHSERAAAEGVAVGALADSGEDTHQWHQRDDTAQSTTARRRGTDGHLVSPNVHRTLGTFESTNTNKCNTGGYSGAGGGSARRISLTPTKAYSSGDDDDDEEGSKIGDDDSDDRPRLRSPAAALGQRCGTARRHPAVVAGASADGGSPSHHGAHLRIERQRKRDEQADLEGPAVNEARSRVVSVGDESALLSSASFCASLGESSDRRRDAWRRQRERLSALTAIVAEATADDAAAKRQQHQHQRSSLEGEGERAGRPSLAEERKEGPLPEEVSRIGLGPTYRLAPPPSEAVGHRYAPPDAVRRGGGGCGGNAAGPSSTRYSAAAAAQPSPPVVSLVSRALSASQQRSVSERSRGTHDNDGHHYARASGAQQWDVVHEQSCPNENDSHRNECRTAADTSAADSSVYCGQAPLRTTAAPPPHHRQQRRAVTNGGEYPEGSYAAKYNSDVGPSSHRRSVHDGEAATDREAWEVDNVPRRFVADRSVLGSAAGATSRYSHKHSSSSPPPPSSWLQRRQKRADAWEPSGFGGVDDGGHSLPTPISKPQQWSVSGGVRGGVGGWTEAAPPPFADGPSPAATSMFASPPPRAGAGGVYGGGTTYSGARNYHSEERNKQQQQSGGAHRSRRADSFECVPPPPNAAAAGVHHSQYAHSPSSSVAAAATTRVLFCRGNAASNATAVSGGFDSAGAGGGDEPSLYVDPTLGSQWHAAAPSAVEEEGHRRQHQQQWPSAVASPPPLSPMTPQWHQPHQHHHQQGEGEGGENDDYPHTAEWPNARTLEVLAMAERRLLDGSSFLSP